MISTSARHPRTSGPIQIKRDMGIQRSDHRYGSTKEWPQVWEYKGVPTGMGVQRSDHRYGSTKEWPQVREYKRVTTGMGAERSGHRYGSTKEWPQVWEYKGVTTGVGVQRSDHRYRSTKEWPGVHYVFDSRKWSLLNKGKPSLTRICCIIRDTWPQYCGHCGLYWNEISDKLAKQGAMKNMSEISSNNLLLSPREINSLLKKTVYKQIEKSKSAIPSRSRYLARVIYKLRLNSWNTKYSQNVTCVCKNVLSVKYIQLECPITTVI